MFFSSLSVTEMVSYILHKNGGERSIKETLDTLYVAERLYLLKRYSSLTGDVICANRFYGLYLSTTSSMAYGYIKDEAWKDAISKERNKLKLLKPFKAQYTSQDVRNTLDDAIAENVKSTKCFPEFKNRKLYLSPISPLEIAEYEGENVDYFAEAYNEDINVIAELEKMANNIEF